MKTTKITYISVPLVPRLRNEEYQSTTSPKAKSNETLAKGTVAKLLYGRSDAKDPITKPIGKLEKTYVNIDL